MSSKLPSARFAAIYDSLPADAQRLLVEKQLIPLLNLVEKGRKKRVLASAAQLERRHTAIPILDLRAKEIEISALMDELHKDAKRSFVKERSNKTELLNETVSSLTFWLNDIWSIAYEHNVSFMHAHKCLLFVSRTLEDIGAGRSGCKCAFTSMYVPVTLKRKSGKRIKTFDVNGAHNLEEVLLYIWRDLFLSLLATGTRRQIDKMPEMLEDIERLMGWPAVERVLYGGRRCPHDFDPDEDEEMDIDDDFDEYIDEDDADYDEELSEADFDSLPYYANHWSVRVSNQMWLLRKHIHSTMTAVFRVTPSLSLYNALIAVSTNHATTQVQLLKHLSSIATSSASTFVAALEIHSIERNTVAVLDLLDTHSHLLRGRDAPSLQAAVSSLAAAHHPRALQIVEKELTETARGVRTALLVSFSQLDAPMTRADLQQILKLRQGAATRQERIETWVDAASTPGTGVPNPMAFAAMMMGLPLVPGMDPSEDSDPLGYLDLDPHDPDLEDIRDEFRPKLKARFESWVEVAMGLKDGPPLLQKVYRDIIELMPFLRAADIVEEMVGRLADKPSRHHVCDGVDALLGFVKSQRRVVALQKRRANSLRDNCNRTDAAEGAAGPSTAASSATPPTSNFSFVASTIPAIFGSGGMEDVD